MLEIDTIWQKRKKIAEERMKHCEECEYYRPSTTQCTKCSCFMKVKAFWPGAKCPINKWDCYEEKPPTGR